MRKSWDLSVESGEECEAGERDQGLAEVFSPKSLEIIERFEAEADVCVCCTHGEQYEQLT